MSFGRLPVMLDGMQAVKAAALMDVICILPAGTSWADLHSTFQMPQCGRRQVRLPCRLACTLASGGVCKGRIARMPGQWV